MQTMRWEPVMDKETCPAEITGKQQSQYRIFLLHHSNTHYTLRKCLYKFHKCASFLTNVNTHKTGQSLYKCRVLPLE